MKHKTKKLLGLLMVVVMAMTGLAACGGGGEESAEGGDSGEPIVIKVAHVEVEDRAIHQAFVKFGEYIEEESGGQLTVEIHPNGELGDDTDVIESIGMGTIHMTAASSAVYETYDQKFAAFNFPYLFESKEQMDASYTGEFGDLMAEWLEEYGFVCLGYNYDGARCVSNNIHPIETVADMKGLKLRVMDSPLYVEMFSLMGANPTPMSYNEIYTALQQGTVDGQDNPAGLTYGSKFNEVLKYFSQTGHVYANCPVIIGKDFFYSLSEEHQAIIREGGQKFLEEWQRAEESAAEASFVDQIAADGTEVNALSEEAIAELKETVQPVYDSYREILGDETMDQILDSIAE